MRRTGSTSDAVYRYTLTRRKVTQPTEICQQPSRPCQRLQIQTTSTHAKSLDPPSQLTKIMMFGLRNSARLPNGLTLSHANRLGDCL